MLDTFIDATEERASVRVMLAILSRWNVSENGLGTQYIALVCPAPNKTNKERKRRLFTFLILVGVEATRRSKPGEE
ncbi:hypothetical protein DAERI_130078 [Deinococcus aerius]|uniref:Uncharacterized protein n=1 Tax=Deinococcus aerius TaxID=200253 RepID=A0A2I9DLA4_9DEIO|nr:hypothetical protein DAERI_130078 [Deinococcus aerius]